MEPIWGEVARVFLAHALGEKTSEEALREFDAMTIPERDKLRFLRARKQLEDAVRESERRRNHDHATINALAAVMANVDLLRFALASLSAGDGPSDASQMLTLALEASKRAQTSSVELSFLLRDRRVSGT